MKDAYSFHGDEGDLASMYAQMERAYTQVFQRCGLTAVGVDADSGAIGGAASQEFMVTADAGEDLILISPDGDYAANQEKAVSIAPPALPLPSGEPKVIATPGQVTIDALCSAHALDPSQVVKVLLLLAKLESGDEQPVLVCLRGDQELNEVKLVNALTQQLDSPVLDLKPINAEQLKSQGLQPFPFGSIGPDLSDHHLAGAHSWRKKFYKLADTTAAELDRFVCGANTNDEHRWGCNWSDLGSIAAIDLRNARAGDRCVHRPEQSLEERRGIEVGHIFQLGRKYSQSMGAQITTNEGKQEHLWMGCYGIGISRLAQAAVEQHHDDAGMIWPLSIAPFQVIVVVANIQDEVQMALGEEIYNELRDTGIDALLDDRGERAGVKFKDADLIGIPWRVVVGRAAAEGNVELVQRSKRDANVLSRAEAISSLLEAIPTKLRVQL
jgi:prolyl-tRNA synthetase